MDTKLSKNGWTYHTFLLLVRNSPINKSNIDLKKLVKEFPLDVSIDKENGLILQGSKIVNKAFEICSKRSKNKKITNDAQGFISISYPISSTVLYYCFPPEPIDIGCYCDSCNQKGPQLHRTDCHNPKRSNLYFTFQGFLKNIDSKYYKLGLHKGRNKKNDTEYDEILYENCNKLIFFIKKYNSKHELPCDDISCIKSDIDSLLYDSLFNNDEHMKVALSDFIILTKNDKEGNFFAGPVMITYKINSKTVTIRIRSSSNIEIISNPCDYKYIYKDVIDRINKTSQNVEFVNKDIKTYFASVNLFNMSYYDKYQLDLEKIKEYLWPDDNTGPKICIDGEYFISANVNSNKNIIFRYIVNKDENSNNRLYINLYKYYRFGHKITNTFYKINVQLFSEGHLQATFGYDKTQDSVNILDSFEKQEENIKKIFNEIQDLFIYHLNILYENDNNMLRNKVLKQESTKIKETRTGIIPYAKRKKFPIDSKVNLYNYSTKTWSLRPYIVAKYNNTSNKYYIKKDKTTTQLIECEHNDLRSIYPNNDQVCRLKEKRITIQPYPYSYFGRCQGGKNYYIHPGGMCSRNDNNFYPYSIQLTPDSKKWIYNFILNGFTEEELKYYKISESGVDIQCGTFIPGTCKISNNILIEHNDSVYNVTILKINKTHGLGNDLNHVEYTVVDEHGSCIVITGNQISEKYYENRYFEGLNVLTESEKMDILMSAARKLHLYKEKKYDYFTFDTVLLSSYNILELLKLNSFDFVIFKKYIEDIDKCIVYYNYKNKKYSFGSLDKSDQKLNCILYDSNIFILNDNKYYENSIIIDNIEFNILKIDKYNSRSCYLFDILKNSVNSHYLWDNIPLVVYFITDEKIYEWCTISRDQIVVKYPLQNNVLELLESINFPVDLIHTDNEDIKYVSFKPNMCHTVLTKTYLLNHNCPLISDPKYHKSEVKETPIDVIGYILYPIHLTYLDDETIILNNHKGSIKIERDDEMMYNYKLI